MVEETPSYKDEYFSDYLRTDRELQMLDSARQLRNDEERGPNRKIMVRGSIEMAELKLSALGSHQHTRMGSSSERLRTTGRLSKKPSPFSLETMKHLPSIENLKRGQHDPALLL
jgi:hypothetical protein